MPESVSLLAAIRRNCADARLSLPNLLTAVRVPLGVVGIMLFASGNEGIGLAVIVIAALTDWADGYTARLLNEVTEFGRKADPVADKLYMVIVSIFVALQLPFELGAVVWLVLAQELHAMHVGAQRDKQGLRILVSFVGKMSMAAKMSMHVAFLLAASSQDTTAKVAVVLGVIFGLSGLTLSFLANRGYAAQARRQLN